MRRKSLVNFHGLLAGRLQLDLQFRRYTYFLIDLFQFDFSFVEFILELSNFINETIV
jgi:hypothetical protein